MRHSEDDLQQAVMQYLRLALPRAIAWHTPNGGRRKLLEAKRLKAMGVLPGVPDVLILAGGELYGVELKAGRNGLSPAQKELHPRLEAQGVRVAVCRSVDDVKAALAGWGLLARGEAA